jgi:hypothetical protein
MAASMSKAAARKPSPAPSEHKAPEAPQHLSFTLDMATGQVDRIEAIAADGGRRELSQKELSALTENRDDTSLEAIVEEAFLAGIEYILGDEDGEDDEPQSQAEEALLRPMIQHSAAGRLIRRDLLRRAAVEDFLREALASKPTRGEAH